MELPLKRHVAYGLGIFPLSQGLLLIPLALEGHTGARPHGCRKVAIWLARECVPSALHRHQV